MKYKQLLMKIVLTVFFIHGITWLSFAQRDSLTIEMALDLAEENNLQLKTQKLNLERSRYALEAERAGLKARFTLDLTPVNASIKRSFDERTSNWYQNESFRTGANFSVRQTILPTDATVVLSNKFNWQYSHTDESTRLSTNRQFVEDLSISLNQPLFMHNTQKMALRSLEISYENQGISYALQRLNTEVSITRQFYNVYSAQERLKINKEELESSQANYDIIKLKTDAELSKKSELSQAEVNLATAKSTVENNITSLENFKDALKQTLGIPLSEDIAVKANIQVDAILIDLNKALQSAMASRMELRQRELDWEEAEMRLIETKNRNSFNGSLSLSLGVVSNDEVFTNLIDKPVMSPNIMLSFQVPIFDWGARKSRIKAQETQMAVTKLNAENQVISMESDIRSLVRQIHNSGNLIEIEKIRLANAQIAFELNEVLYRAGDINGVQFNLVQTQLSSSKLSFSQTLISYRLELLNLKIATLYDFENKVPVIPVKNLE
jgi:outer membrane protein TolC